MNTSSRSNKTPPPIPPEAHLTHISGYLKEVVFGFNDGVVSTFAVVAGLSGAATSHQTILLAALSTLFAGAFSMGLGTYLGSKSEKDLYDSELEREKFEIKNMPDIERQEIVDIYAAKGFKGKLLDDIVNHTISNEELWLDTMMREELGFAEKPPKPGLNGIYMSTAFVIGSLMATVPYFFPAGPIIENGILSGMNYSFVFSLIASVIGLLLAGAIKTKFTRKNMAVSAAETLFVGTLSAVCTYIVGRLFT